MPRQLELLQWWARLEPAAAVEYANRRPAVHGRSGLAVELFRAWLEINSAAAVQWAVALPAGELRARLLPVVIAVVAEERPIEALRMADGLRGENRAAGLTALFSQWAAHDPLRAAEQARQFGDAKEQNLGLRVVLGKWMDRDPAAAIAWAKRLPPEPPPDSTDVFPPVIGVVIEKWATQAPADAAAYVVGMPEIAGRTTLLRSVAAEWARTDSRAALAWASTIPDDRDRATMVRGVLAQVAESDMQAAAELALSAGTKATTENGLPLVIEQWVARDSAALSAWAASLAGRPERVAYVVTAWAGADLPATQRWLETLAPGEARDAGCEALARNLASRRPDLAREWATRIFDPRLRAQIFDALSGAR